MCVHVKLVLIKEHHIVPLVFIDKELIDVLLQGLHHTLMKGTFNYCIYV